MSTAQTANTAVPSVPEHNLPAANAVGMHVLPSSLPGQRTAMRLLDVVDQLARHTQQLERKAAQAVEPGPVPPANPHTEQELLALQRENSLLKARQTEAKRRLEALLKRVQAAQAAAPSDDTEISTSLSTPEGNPS